MWLWFKTLFVYLHLLVFGWKSRHKFLHDVIKNCKKRRQRIRVPGITEELDEVTEVPDNCVDDLHFTGFSENGEVLVFKTTKTMNREEIVQVVLDLPGVGRFKHSTTRSLNFGAGNLNLEMVEPMRQWKVSFRGTMKRLVSGMYTERVHASVSLYWKCVADPFDHWTSLSAWHLARNLAMDSWEELWKTISQRRIWYEQWGELRGSVRIEGQDDRLIRLKGFRSRKIEDIAQTTRRNVVSHHAIVDGGKLLLTNGCIVSHGNTGQETFGYVTYPLGEMYATNQSDLLVDSRESIFSMAIKYPLHTEARGVSYNVASVSTKTIAVETSSEVIKTIVYVSTFRINGDAAYGINIAEAVYPERIQNNSDKGGKDVVERPRNDSKIATHLQSPDCRNIRLVGGKGANLAVLNDLGYLVPNAICITTSALKMHLQTNRQLRIASEKINSAIERKGLSQIPEVCSEAVQLYTNTDIHQTVKDCILPELKNTFGPEFQSKSFAVRSSCVAEDGKETSAAGQMESYLAVKGLDQIMKAIRKCWASSLAYQAVEYRRQNGQPVIEAMAVVIQEMVDADVAGVLFTNDPVTGNSCSMVINAAQGLGETVVSGKTDPDTIWVARGNSPDSFEIKKTIIGKKQVRMRLAAAGDAVDEIENDEVSGALCLDDNQIRNICRIGLELEEHYGCPQDVEWAISNGCTYLLQARPVTSIACEPDENMIHEFDTPITMDTECLTTCNIGEMCPGSATPLTLDAFMRGISIIFARICRNACGYLYPQYPDRVCGSCAGRPFTNFTTASASILGDCLVTKNDYEVLVLGQPLEEHTIDTVQTCMGRPPSKFQLLKGLIVGKVIEPWQQVKQFDKWSKMVDTFNIGEDASSAKALYEAIDERRHIYFDVWYGYAYKMQAISFSIIMGMLRGKNTSVSTENSSDLAILLAHSKNVYTADVPTSIAELAQAIADSSIKDEFLKLPEDRCHSMLMNCEDEVRTKYASFLDKHGHRCIKEVDFMEKSWAADPSKLMSALKPMIEQTNLKPRHEELSNREIVDMLQTPLSWFQKFLIRNVLLDMAKACVGSREFGKSITIQTIDVFKRAYWRLADLMVREGRLPDDDLLFFLTHREIGILLETRSASLVQRAKSRRRVFPAQEAIRLPKINFGPMVPLPNRSNDASNDTSLCLNGMPVGKGVATGRACVLKSLADARNIRKGDILICPFTDIGWSPYFSMISGLVTEMGGLISHGAVVAREVGIPCVVNVTDATVLFQTGDKVRIDGLKGVCERLVE